MTRSEIDLLQDELRELRRRLLLLSDRVPVELLPLVRGEAIELADPFDSFGMWKESTLLEPVDVESLLAEAWGRIPRAEVR